MEIFFPEHGVRYIAINDGYDSNEQSQMDIAPFRNIINEMYAKDTSRKIKSALGHARKVESISPAAHRLATRKTLPTTITFVIDPNTAPVVRVYLFNGRGRLGFTASPSGSTMKKF